jgi:hypothetical protein
MNKSFSKIRHIQESNQILEQRLLSEQGFKLYPKNVFIGDIEINGLESKNQSLKIDDVNGDKVTISNLSNPIQRNIEGVKDLTLNPNGKTYKITNGKGKFILKTKK